MSPDLDGQQIPFVVKKECLNEEQVVLYFNTEDVGETDSELYFEIWNTPSAGTEKRPICVHKSEEIDTDRILNWRPFIIPTKLLCDDQLEQAFKIEFVQYNGFYRVVGKIATTLAELIAGKRDFRIMTESKAAENESISIGKLYIKYFRILKPYLYTDYVAGGLKFHTTIAIDFSASDKDPDNPKSLHLTSSSITKDYEEVIYSMFSVLAYHAHNEEYSVLGFGAESHSSPSSSVFCVSQHGVSGSAAAYRNCVSQIQQPMSAKFAPVIRHIIESARDHKTNGGDYFILVILTDGQITDFEETTEAIVEASILPVSIIIVGVGEQRFYHMEELDGDDKPLQANGRKAERDIVHFVAFNEVKNLSGTRLAEELLAGIPQQVMHFMRSHMFKPKHFQ